MFRSILSSLASLAILAALPAPGFADPVKLQTQLTDIYGEPACAEPQAADKPCPRLLTLGILLRQILNTPDPNDRAPWTPQDVMHRGSLIQGMIGAAEIELTQDDLTLIHGAMEKLHFPSPVIQKQVNDLLGIKIK